MYQQQLAKYKTTLDIWQQKIGSLNGLNGLNGEFFPNSDIGNMPWIIIYSLHLFGPLHFGSEQSD